MKNNILILLSLFFSVFVFPKAQSQTSGTLNFSITVTEPSGGYNNKLVIAIWLEDSASGNFIKTKIRYAQTEVQYLNVWIAKSGQNVVDAITGATTHPGTFSFLWNGTDINGTLVPDGTYNVWVQFSDRNSSGPTKFCSFTKSSNDFNQSYPNSGNFTNMALTWTPTTSIVENLHLKEDFCSVYPNPVKDKAFISFTLEKDAPVSIIIYDYKGSYMGCAAHNLWADKGNSVFVWDVSQSKVKITAGIYFIKIITPTYETIKKVSVL